MLLKIAFVFISYCTNTYYKLQQRSSILTLSGAIWARYFAYNIMTMLARAVKH